MLAPKLHFLPSPCSLLEKLWQLPPFPSSPQLLLLAASSPPSLCFLCRNQIPHYPNCCCLFPRQAGGALSLSPFLAMGLCIYALASLISISFICFQVLLPFKGRVLCVCGPGAASSCLCVFLYAHAYKFFPLFCSRLSLLGGTSLQTRTSSYSEEVES